MHCVLTSHWSPGPLLEGYEGRLSHWTHRDPGPSALCTLNNPIPPHPTHPYPLQSAVELDSVLAELPLLVRGDEQPELYKLSEEDVVELGPFQVGGLWGGRVGGAAVQDG